MLLTFEIKTKKTMKNEREKKLHVYFKYPLLILDWWFTWWILSWVNSIREPNQVNLFSLRRIVWH